MNYTSRINKLKTSTPYIYFKNYKTKVDTKPYEINKLDLSDLYTDLYDFIDVIFNQKI